MELREKIADAIKADCSAIDQNGNHHTHIYGAVKAADAILELPEIKEALEMRAKIHEAALLQEFGPPNA